MRFVRRLIPKDAQLPDTPPSARIVFSKSTYTSSTPLGIKQRIRGAARDFVGSVFSTEFLIMWCMYECLFLVGIGSSMHIMGLSFLHPLCLILVLLAAVGSLLPVLLLLIIGTGLFLFRPQELLNLHLYPDLVNLYDDRFVFSWTKQGKKKNLHISWSWIKTVRFNNYLYMGAIPLPVLDIELAEIPVSRSQFAMLRKLSRKGTCEDLNTKRLIRDFPLAGIRLPLPLFAFTQDVELFLQNIREKSGSEVLDQSVQEMLNETDLESFTAMWLSELSGTQPSLTRQLSVGTSLKGGDYIVTGIMGHGGFSVVYEASRENRENDKVAIKEIVCNFGGTSKSLERNLRQILHEASVLSRLEHPNIVKFEQCFSEGNRLYIVMEALSGVNLRHYGTVQSRHSEETLLEIATQCCSILDYLHTQNDPIIHRDFTPDNLMYCDGVVKLLDFNIAQSAITSSSDTIVGKHCYMAPEQFCGEYTTGGDLYQLGATLFFLATGEDPEPLGPCDLRLARTDLSETFVKLVDTLTDRSPGNRPASAKEALHLIRPTTVCK